MIHTHDNIYVSDLYEGSGEGHPLSGEKRSTFATTTRSMPCLRVPGKVIRSAGRRKTDYHDGSHVFNWSEGYRKGYPLGGENTNSHDGRLDFALYEGSKKGNPFDGEKNTRSSEGRRSLTCMRAPG